MLLSLNKPYKDRDLQYFQAGPKEAFPVFGPLQQAAVVILRVAMAQIPNGDLLNQRKATAAALRSWGSGASASVDLKCRAMLLQEDHIFKPK